MISRRLRYEILRRDGHTCRYCGASAPDVALTVDHVVPSALGGSDEPGNLVSESWGGWGCGEGEERRSVPKPADWSTTVGRWFDAGLDLQTIVPLITEVNRWRYFCGCVWNVLRERQQIARSVIEADA